MATTLPAAPITIGETRHVLAAIRDESRRIAGDLDDMAGKLAQLDLDEPTLRDVAAILDAAEATNAAADRALTGLKSRHATIEEAINTSRPNIEPAGAPARSAESREPVSFANIGRDERLTAMRAEIDAAMERLADPAGWKAFLASAASFHRYSLNNTILALSQKPDATLLAGFKDWKNNHRRTVRKGAKAIWIYAPLTYTVTETDPDTGQEKRIQQVRGFRPVPVFDVSQTDGEPLPQAPITPMRELVGDAPATMDESLADQVASRGFTVRRESVPGKRDGYTDFNQHLVVVNADASPAQQALTLAHELAHIALGHGELTTVYHTGAGGRRSDMEIEAESVAYVLARHYGIADAGENSFGYIANWARGDTTKVRDTAERVLAAVRTILDYERTATGNDRATLHGRDHRPNHRLAQSNRRQQPDRPRHHHRRALPAGRSQHAEFCGYCG